MYNFTTAPVDDSEFSFILLSDLQLKMESPATVKMAGQEKPDFILYPGDFQNTPWKSGEGEISRVFDSFMIEANK